MRRALRGVVAAIAATAFASSLTACTGTSHPGAVKTAATIGSSAAPATHGPALRWWSNSVATAGSTIDPRNPAAVATKLAPSRAEYCEMLAQTLQAGKSILSGIAPNDPALLNSAIAFVTELQRVAPDSVAASWRTLAPALLTLVRSNGSAPTQSKSDVTETADAAKAVATDAKKNCGLSLAPPKR